MTQDDAGSAPMRGSQPVAWATVSTEGATAGTLWTFSDSIEAAFRKKVDSYQPCDIMPLYSQPQPTLTDAEREAIERAILELDGIMQEFIPTPVEMRLKRHVAALRSLLERMK